MFRRIRRFWSQLRHRVTINDCQHTALCGDIWHYAVCTCGWASRNCYVTKRGAANSAAMHLSFEGALPKSVSPVEWARLRGEE